MQGSPAVEAAGVHKRFGSTRALRGVDLSLQPGRCLGLVGRNGAGKSTLVSILSGLYPPDAGEVRLDGQSAPSLGDIAAWRGRIATVFQHSMVVPGLTVAENVFLGRQPLRRGLRVGIVDWRRMREQTRKVMTDWGFDVNADTACGNLTVEQRQVVEITRALAAWHALPAARRADRGARARRRAAPVRARPPAAGPGRRDPVHLPSSRGGLRDLHGCCRPAGRRDGADRAAARGDQG